MNFIWLLVAFIVVLVLIIATAEAFGFLTANVSNYSDWSGDD